MCIRDSNKFVVIDGLYVWTGSTNLKPNAFYRNNNNAMLIRSSRLAQNYTAEFEELFAGKFGKSSPKGIPNRMVTVSGTRIETYFESEGDVGARLAALIEEAHSVRFMAFSFTDSLEWTEGSTQRSVMMLLRDRALAGALDVRGIIEASGRSQIKPLILDFQARWDQRGLVFGFGAPENAFKIEPANEEILFVRRDQSRVRLSFAMWDGSANLNLSRLVQRPTGNAKGKGTIGYHVQRIS